MTPDETRPGQVVAANSERPPTSPSPPSPPPPSRARRPDETPTVSERALRDEIRALRHQLAQCQDARALAEASRPQCPKCGVVT